MPRDDPVRRWPQIPQVEVLGIRWYQLASDYCYEWTHKGVRHRIIVRAPFCFDGASIPRFLLWLLDHWGLSLVGPLLHDWIYRYRGHLPPGSHQILEDGVWVDVKEPWSRRGGDRLMGKVMRDRGIPKWARRGAYLLIRAFGWITWLTRGEDWS